jgi:hypothetical protein
VLEIVELLRGSISRTPPRECEGKTVSSVIEKFKVTDYALTIELEELRAVENEDTVDGVSVDARTEYVASLELAEL